MTTPFDADVPWDEIEDWLAKNDLTLEPDEELLEVEDDDFLVADDSLVEDIVDANYDPENDDLPWWALETEGYSFDE